MSQAVSTPDTRIPVSLQPEGPTTITPSQQPIPALYTSAIRQDLTVEQHFTWNGSALNHPIQRLPSKVSSHQPEYTTTHHALHHSCLVSEPTILYYYNAHHSLRSHSPLKTVFGKLEDTYQAYCNTYKTHTMATHHGGSGHPLDSDIDVTREVHKTTDTDIEKTQDFYPLEAYCFEDLEHNNPKKLSVLTREIDGLCQ